MKTLTFFFISQEPVLSMLSYLISVINAELINASSIIQVLYKEHQT